VLLYLCHWLPLVAMLNGPVLKAEWMNEWKRIDFKCIQKPTKSWLSLTHHVNKSSRWATVIMIYSVFVRPHPLLYCTFLLNPDALSEQCSQMVNKWQADCAQLRILQLAFQLKLGQASIRSALQLKAAHCATPVRFHLQGPQYISLQIQPFCKLSRPTMHHNTKFHYNRTTRSAVIAN